MPETVITYILLQFGLPSVIAITFNVAWPRMSWKVAALTAALAYVVGSYLVFPGLFELESPETVFTAHVNFLDLIHMMLIAGVLMGAPLAFVIAMITFRRMTN